MEHGEHDMHADNDGAPLMLSPDVLSETLTTATGTGAEFAEVFVEDRRSISALFDDGRVEELTSGRDRGAGLRVVVGDTTGFAHTADLSPSGLTAAAEAAAAAARGGGGGICRVVLDQHTGPTPGPVEIMPGDVSKARKVALLERADSAARASDG
ncbi:MAG TPA: DNA gyrase modulator, partial [Acidimicrobiales bacterium]|nr:DNA gyrase modulator [Acidimicrobiales bacterium]